MSTNLKNKEIQVQKPAQSLQAFQQMMAAKPDEGVHAGFKLLLLCVGVLALLAFGYLGFNAWRSVRVEKHEAALSVILREVASAPLPEQEARMRERLPKLETLLQSAPSSCKSGTAGILATWRLELDGKTVTPPQDRDPWSILRTVQKQIAIGQGKEALESLAPLRQKADPDVPWASEFWRALMLAHQLNGDRDQALKDYSDYQKRFRTNANDEIGRLAEGV